MKLEKYSIGIGDRFGCQGAAQLVALERAAARGLPLVPVWNKSEREHLIVGTGPEHQRRAADEAVRARGWDRAYYVDADHIGMETVDRYLPWCDFYTIDVADFIGKPPEDPVPFLRAMERYRGALVIPGASAPVVITDAALGAFARKYLRAVGAAAGVYRHIADKKGEGTFVTEISVDEAAGPQTPVELLLIMAALGLERVPVETLAPRFSGAFLKGSDYVGDVRRFEREFRDDLAVIAFAVKEFGLPGNLKLSIHTGSDKFSLYPVMHRALRAADAGIHLKTAGTTWLEELAGLAAAGGEGLDFAREIYREAYGRSEELCRPYLAVIDIDARRLPPPEEVDGWGPEEFVRALEHDLPCASCNPHLRQLLHVGFRVAAERRARFEELLGRHRDLIGDHVARNLYDKHIVPLFFGVE
jgi:hypothetical protein